VAAIRARGDTDTNAAIFGGTVALATGADRVDGDAVVIADVFPKKTARTPDQVIETCRRRLAMYDEAVKAARKKAKKKGK
jgi:hypothetical protein